MSIEHTAGDLPLEIWVEILSKVPPGRVCIAALVCRCWRDAAKIVYGRYDMVDRYYADRARQLLERVQTEYLTLKTDLLAGEPHWSVMVQLTALAQAVDSSVHLINADIRFLNNNDVGPFRLCRLCGCATFTPCSADYDSGDSDDDERPLQLCDSRFGLRRWYCNFIVCYACAEEYRWTLFSCKMAKCGHRRDRCRPACNYPDIKHQGVYCQECAADAIHNYGTTCVKCGNMVCISCMPADADQVCPE